MPWEIKDEGDRYVVRCTGDELIDTLPEEVLEEASEDSDLENAIEEVYSPKAVFEFSVPKNEMVNLGE